MKNKKDQKPTFSLLKIGQYIWLTIGIVSMFGGLLAYSMFWPEVSIHQYATLDPKNPFKTIFTIENDSLFTAHITSMDTVLIDVIDAHNNAISSSVIEKKTKSDLASKKETSVSIDLEPAIVGLALPFKKAQIEAVVTYNYLFFSATSTANFTMVYDSSGDAIWAPIELTSSLTQ